MKAIVQDRYGSPDGLRLRDVDKPTIGDDRVLVRVHAASVNAADWHLMRRLPHLIGRFLGMPTSHVPGRDLAGRVEAVGKLVSQFKPGDDVFGVALGSFAEYVAAFESRLAPKPRNLTFEQAAAIPIAGCTALQGLRDKGRLQPRQRVLIYGAGGGVGTFAVQIAKSLGSHVTAVTSTSNLELVRSIGADEAIDYTKEDVTRRGQRYDVLFDLAGNQSFASYRELLTRNGTLVMAGASAARGLAPLTRVLEARVLSRFVSQRFVPFLAGIRHEDLIFLNKLAEAGDLSPVIDRRHALSEVPEAIRYVGTGQARGKVVIRVG